MDKENKRVINSKAQSFETPINKEYVYVREDDTYIVENSEFEMVQDFLKFIRGRKRGIFQAEISTNLKDRFVVINFTDKKMIKLNPID